MALLGFVGLILVIGFRDTIWNRFFRTGYFAPVYMLGVSAVMTLPLGWGRWKATTGWERRMWELGLVILVGGTGAALVAWWDDFNHQHWSRSMDWHTVTLIAACIVVNVPGVVRWLGRFGGTAAEGPSPSPPATPTGVGWLVVIAFLAGPALLFWTQESFWEGYFRPGYTAPVSMLASSGLFLAVLWWCRRQSEPNWYRLVLALAMAAVAVGTLIGLLVSWGEGSYLDKLGEASTWHNGGIGIAAALVIGSALVRVARWAATHPRPWSHSAPPFLPPPAPASAAQTAFALGAGYFALVAGFIVSLMVRDLVTQVETRNLAMSFVLGLWSTAGLLAFGPGVFIARRWWRPRRPEERRADARAGVLAGLGLGATVLLVVLTVVRTPGLRGDLFGDPQPTTSSLALNWNRDLVARVTLERDNTVAEEFEGKVKGVAGHYPPGQYTVRGFKDDREVYREEFALEPGESRAVNLFEAPMSPDYATLRIDCQDPTLMIDVRGPGHYFQFNRPASGETIVQGLKLGVKYRMGMARGQDHIHVEDVRLGPREERAFHIPHIVRPEKTVDLKPRDGSFPTDVVRMEIAPDRSAVAVGRFDGQILVFDRATGTERFTVSRPRSHGTAFGFSSDGKRLAYLTPAGGDEQVLRVVDATTGDRAAPDLKLESGRIFMNAHALAFSPDGNRLAVSTALNVDPDNHWEARVYRWELKPDGPSELGYLEGFSGTIRFLCFTGDGSEVLAAAGANVAVGWRWDSEMVSRRYASDQFTIDVVAAGREHEAIAGWGANRKLALVSYWPPSTLREPPPDDPPLSSVAFGSMAFSPDDRLLAAGAKGLAGLAWEQLAAVHVWDAKSGKERAILLGHTDWTLAIAFDPAGTGLMTTSKDGTVRTWRLP